jgi:LPS-assembly lipoprotein
MRWREARASVGRAARVAIALASAGLAGGCFQPLYGDGALPGSPNARDALRSIEVEQISAAPGSNDPKVAVQMRNDLLFNFTGGGLPTPPAYRLRVVFSGNRRTIGVTTAGVPNAENYGISASYTLTEIATGKQVVTGSATSTVSYDPSGTQRFARISAINDSEMRAGKVITDTITTRLASYFISGS